MNPGMLQNISLLLSLLSPFPQAGMVLTQQPTPSAWSNAAYRDLARQCGTAVQWIKDPYRHVDQSRENRRRNPAPYNPKVDRKLLLEQALKRAKAENRPVLLYAFRIEGRHMYRAPLVDDYMNMALFSDPELVALINRRFIPLRLYVTADIGKSMGIYNKDREDPLFLQNVEPALIVLEPNGKVLHITQRIRTFSVHWTRNLLKKVLARLPDLEQDSLATKAIKSAVSEKDMQAQIHLAWEECLDGNEEAGIARLDKAIALTRITVTDLNKTLDKAKKKEASSKESKAASSGSSRRRRRFSPSAMIARSLSRQLRILGQGTLNKAKALRLLRRGQDALASVKAGLQSIGEDPTSETMRNAFFLEKGRIHVALAQWEMAREALNRARPGSERDFLLAAVNYTNWRVDKAMAQFQASVQGGKAPFNWRSAAMLAKSDDTTPLSPLAHGYEFLSYGREAIYRGLPKTSELALVDNDPAELAAMNKRAVDFLLSQQRPDGSWSDTRYAYWPSPKIIPNVVVAVTALASTALLEHRALDPVRIEMALKKSERFLVDDDRVSQGTEEEVYSQAYRMLYFIRKAEILFGGKDPESFANLDRLVKRAAEIQVVSSGFFGHEYPNAFCTGAMMWSLYLAKKLGIQVSDDMLRLGVKALLSARRKDGSFSYGGSARGRRGGSITSNLKNSSARMPICESVLHVLGSSDPKKVKFAFETFLKYIDKIERVRKCDFHSDGQLGGFFFWHALYHSSEAKGILEPAMKLRVEKAILKVVSTIPEIDGSFIDSHELGKSYGTAMALLVMKNLER